MVAVNVTGHVIPDCGHFLPEECPEEIARQIQAFAKWLGHSLQENEDNTMAEIKAFLRPIFRTHRERSTMP